MRVIGNLPIVKEINNNMPFNATVQNETDTQQGTPIVREHYGDVLMNMYRLLELASITPTNTEDSDLTQYQIVDALKKLPNSLNDIERVLTLNSGIWSTDLDLSILPNNYFFIARASENYDITSTYSFKGTGVVEYTFESTGFKSGDELVVIIDSGGVRAYSLNIFSNNTDIFLAMGSPLSYNDTNVLMYENDGFVYTDLPSSNNLQNVIRSDSGKTDLIINDVFFIKNFILCFCFVPADNEYLFYQFASDDLSSPVNVDVSSILSSGTDFSPYVYTDGNFLYLTNGVNNNALDYAFTKLLYNPEDVEISLISGFNIESSFVKTTNAVVKNNKIITLEGGALTSYDLLSSTKTILGVYNGVLGRLFMFNGKSYFTSGEVGKNWQL